MNKQVDWLLQIVITWKINIFNIKNLYLIKIMKILEIFCYKKIEKKIKTFFILRKSLQDWNRNGQKPVNAERHHHVHDAKVTQLQ